MSTVDTLQTMTEAFPRADREELGRSIGMEWTALAYHGTGSVAALELLAPFLNDSDVRVRRQALEAVGRVFDSTGIGSLEMLTYVTDNRDLFVRDRAVSVVGQALKGEPLEAIAQALEPRYAHRNDFVRGLGVKALGTACDGRADASLVPVFARARRDPSPHVDERVSEGIGLAYAGTGRSDVVDLLLSHGSWGYDEVEEEPLLALARVCRDTEVEDRAVDVIRQQLPARVPHGGEGQGYSFVGRDGVWAMSWLLAGKVGKALAEMEYLLSRPVPNPRWRHWSTRGTAIWSLPDAFVGSGDEGIDAALGLLSAEHHPAIRVGLLGLGLAARSSAREDLVESVAPYLSHGNAAVREAAHVAAGFLYAGTGDGRAAQMLDRANRDDRRGAAQAYPLALGLAYQGSGDPSVSQQLAALWGQRGRRFSRNAALAVGLVYQGTGDPRAVELLLPVLEAGDAHAACSALILVDFSQEQLVNMPRLYNLCDGPGVVALFAIKHA